MYALSNSSTSLEMRIVAQPSKPAGHSSIGSSPAAPPRSSTAGPVSSVLGRSSLKVGMVSPESVGSVAPVSVGIVGPVGVVVGSAGRGRHVGSAGWSAAATTARWSSGVSSSRVNAHAMSAPPGSAAAWPA